MAPAEQVKDLLMWCREKGIQVGRLRVGDIELEVADLEQAKQLATEMAKVQPPAWQPEKVPDAKDLYAHLADSIGHAAADRGGDA